MQRKHYDALTKYEKAFYTAIRSNFARVTVNDFKKICEVYTDMYGEKPTPNQMNCNVCKLKILKRIGTDFFKYKEKLEKKEEKNNGN